MSARKPITDRERQALEALRKTPRRPADWKTSEKTRRRLRSLKLVQHIDGWWEITDAGLAELGSEQ